MMKKWMGVFLLGGISVCAWSQNTAETALLFGRVQGGGSARMQALGGAQISLGGDYSAAGSNPAGLGMYNRSEFSFSGAVNAFNSSSSFLGLTTNASKTSGSLPGLALIFHSPKDKGNLISGTFAITLTRLNDFNRSFRYEGDNDANSIIDYFLEDATGLSPGNFTSGGDYFDTPTGLAYNNYLIEDSTFANPGAPDTQYLSALGVFPNNPADIRRVFQQEEVITARAQNQWSFSYGVNLSDRFFLGGGIGVRSIRYENKKTFAESNFRFDLDPSYFPLDNLKLEETLKITGTGFNATLGIIVRPVDGLQLGLAYNSPSIYRLTDVYHGTLETYWNNFDYFQDGSPFLNDVSEETNDVISEYSLRTPGKISAGLTYFIQKHGFLTFDAESINYAGAEYSSTTSGISYDPDNDQIKALYQNVVNLKAGAEFRLDKFRLRGGYAYFPDPFQEKQNDISRAIQSITGGLGYRTNEFFIDLAVVYSTDDSSYRPYRINSPSSPLVVTENSSTYFLVTVGFSFPSQ